MKHVLVVHSMIDRHVVMATICSHLSRPRMNVEQLARLHSTKIPAIMNANLATHPATLAKGQILATD